MWRDRVLEQGSCSLSGSTWAPVPSLDVDVLEMREFWLEIVGVEKWW